MPRDGRRGEDREGGRPVEGVAESVSCEGAVVSGMAEYGDVVLVFGRDDPVLVPDVDEGGGNVAGVAAGRGGSKWEVVIDVEFTDGVALDDEEALVNRSDGCVPMEGLNIQRSGLCSRGSISGLRGKCVRRKIKGACGSGSRCAISTRARMEVPCGTHVPMRCEMKKKHMRRTMCQ